MPRHTHLLRRNSRYYLNVKVPKDLREVLGKEVIRKSLGTSDPREAARRVRFESSKLDVLFETERRKLEAQAARKASSASYREMSDREVHQLVCRFFVDLEREAEKWWQDKGCSLRDEELENVIETFETDLAVARGGYREFANQDGDMSSSVSAFLEVEGITLPEDSAAFKKLAILFRQAQVEHLRRLIDRLKGGRATTSYDVMFRDLFAHTAVPRIKSITLGELVDRHYKALADVKRTEGTQKTYKIPHRLLCEVLGRDMACSPYLFV